MAASIPWSSSCDGPPRAERQDAAIVYQGGQGQRFLEADPAELPRGRLRHAYVPAVDRGGEDPARMHLRCQRPSRWGRTATLSLTLRLVSESG
jgi:hypothetical protein